MYGHVWTLRRHALDTMRPPGAPPSRPWSTRIVDPDVGPLTLTGAWSSPSAPTGAVLVVHGLGGSAESPYVRRFARLAMARGLATLRLNLRGADLRGGDFYHAGLTADLAAARASPELAGVDRLYLIGFSLGGHIALRHAIEAPAGLRAVAALCAPLDLAASCAKLEQRRATLYRLHLLRGLRRVYAAVAATRPVPVPPAALRRITSLYAWDGQVVAPRFGFADADDYYRQVSVAPRLAELAVPGLYLGADRDPMVVRASVGPALERAGRGLEVRWHARGGHVGFPEQDVVDGSVLDWMLAR